MCVCVCVCVCIYIYIHSMEYSGNAIYLTIHQLQKLLQSIPPICHYIYTLQKEPLLLICSQLCTLHSLAWLPGSLAFSVHASVHQKSPKMHGWLSPHPNNSLQHSYKTKPPLLPLLLGFKSINVRCAVAIVRWLLRQRTSSSSAQRKTSCFNLSVAIKWEINKRI